MSYTLTFSQTFEKHFKAFSERQRKQIANKLKILVENPAHPSLRVKKDKRDGFLGDERQYGCSDYHEV